MFYDVLSILTEFSREVPDPRFLEMLIPKVGPKVLQKLIMQVRRRALRKGTLEETSIGAVG